MRKSVIAAISVLLLLSAAGCSKTSKNTSKAEESIQSSASNISSESSAASQGGNSLAVSDTESNESSMESTTESSEAKTDDPLGINEKIQTVETYQFDDPSGLKKVALLLYNKSDVNCRVDCEVKFYDSDESVIDSKTYTLPAFEADTIEAVTLGLDPKCSNINYKIIAKAPNDNTVFLNKKLTRSVEEKPEEKTAIVTVTNEADVPADAKATVLFFKDYKVVYEKTVSVGTNDGLLEPGKTEKVTVSCPVDYHYTRVEVFGNGEKE